MNLQRFCVDVQTKLQSQGYSLEVVCTAERESPVVVTRDRATFEYSGAGDEWTTQDLSPGGEQQVFANCFVGLTIMIRGISRQVGATRKEHCDHVRLLTEQLVWAIERVRKVRHFRSRLGKGVMLKPTDYQAGATTQQQPEQGARYVLELQLGVPVAGIPELVIDGSAVATTGTVDVTQDGTTLEPITPIIAP